MIDSAKRKAVEVTVVCAGGICGSLKMPVVISDAILGTIDKLSIAGWPTDYTGEMAVSDEILKRAADSYRRIRNWYPQYSS